MVEDALSKGQYQIHTVRDSYKFSDYFNPYEECWVTVTKCNLDANDFNFFFNQNPQYKPDGVKTRREFKYRHEYFYVTSFSFHNDHKILPTLEFAIRLENKNQKLKLPNFQELNETSSFYQKYVKNVPKVAGKFREEFKSVFSQYLSGNPDALKRFCDGSPYQNNELVHGLDVWQLLCRSQKKYDFVYYLSANNGYYFDKNNQYNYNGELKNGLPNGRGNNRGWEGTFKDGKKTGPFTYKKNRDYYEGARRASEPDEDNGHYEFFDKYTYKYTGNCVNDQWEGEVRVEIAGTKGFGSDIYIEHYSHGQMTNSTLVSENLTDRLLAQRISENNRIRSIRQQIRQMQENQRLEEASVNVNTVRNYVKSIDQDTDRGNWVSFEVKFTDGKSGWIEYDKSKGTWGGQVGWDYFGFVKYDYPNPNSQTAAILVLYRYLHR